MPQLQPISLVAPGSQGLNTENEFNLLPPQWATDALNCVVTDGGRIGARKGWLDQTTTPIAGTPSIDVIHEFIQKDGVRTIITVAANKIYKNISDFTDVANDITSTTAPTADNWQFLNFNDYCIGVQKGENAIARTTADFADISFSTTGQVGTVDIGNAATAAFGRVWYIDADLQTLRYSALLDHTDLTTANGGGQIDMSSVWTNGMDEIVAIAALGANLIIFGRNHIVMWADSTGSEIGIDPSVMYVVDTIEGTGCIARDSIQTIGEGDLWFLSRHGIQSLGRVIQDKNNPMTSITKNVKSKILGYIATEVASDSALDAVRSTYSPEEQFYLLIMPTNDKVVCVDARRPFQDMDGTGAFAITEWVIGGTIKDACSRQNGDLLFASTGVVGKYSDYLDDTAAYDMTFWSGWLDFGPDMNNRLKMLKEVSVLLQVGGGSSATFRWEFDFSGDVDTYTVSYATPGSSEYGVAEYSLDEYAGGLTLQRQNFAGSNQGQYLRVGSSVSVNAFNFILQQLQLVPKLGRLVV